MGLDQYVYATTEEQIGYFRKVNWLHNWMEKLWNEKGGEGEFNLKRVELLEEDLDKLEKDIENNNIEPISGFFFGSQEIYEEDIQEVKNMINIARSCIKNGQTIYYDSWW